MADEGEISRRGRVLSINDDPRSRRLLKSLVTTDWTVIHLQKSETALLQKIFIAGSTLPATDIVALKSSKDKSDTPVLVISGSADTQQKGVCEGVNWLLERPALIRELLDIIETSIGEISAKARRDAVKEIVKKIIQSPAGNT